jgi:formate hydrogenlyase subunit 3/multisubunit Na+/H+ antiporter MnhD subunit
VAASSGRLLAELGLTLGLEACALHLVFADNLLWLGLAWVLVVGLAWLLGEQGAEGGQYDFLGLACMLIGPVITMLVLLLISLTPKEHTLFGLAGHSAASPLQIILLAIALTLAGGGYPFAAWVRRRAAFTTPSGFAALLLLTLPVVVFVAARAWAALRSFEGLWPEIGAVIPPITGGIALAVLGALTLAISGLLALGRRDGRTLVALLATAQVGWGLFALGSSQPAAAIGVVFLLATSVVGLGAMIVSLVAGGVLTADDEPEAAGPVPFGLAPRPLNLFAWCVGAATLLGIPFFGGFVARHLITSGTLSGTKLAIPLLGLAWLGDALFAVALTRATVLAFRADPADSTEEVADEDVSKVTSDANHRASTTAELLELPGVALALIGIALSIVPQTFMSSLGALFATDQLAPEGAASGALRILPFGYATSNSQWLPGIFWLAALVLGAVALLLRIGSRRTAVTLETSGGKLLTGMESDALDEPAAVWLDLAPSFTSPWTQLAGRQLIGGIDEDDDYAETLDEKLDEEDDEGDDTGDDESGPPDAPDGEAEPLEPAAPVEPVEAVEKRGKGVPANGVAKKSGARNSAKAEKRGQAKR